MIHKLSLIDPLAKIDDGVTIGPYSVIGPEVEIGKNSIIGGECSTPGIISLIGVCNNYKTKKLLELNEKSNVLVIGCEGNADVKLYKQLLSKGRK